MQDLEKILNFFIAYKNKEQEVEDILNMKENITLYNNSIRNSDYFKEYYDNYLLIKGYTYRLVDDKQRLFYTFREAVYSCDLAKLTKDDEGIKLNSFIYMCVIKDCISELLEEVINEDEKQEAIAHYEKEQKRKSQEDSKYHMYQY